MTRSTGTRGSTVLGIAALPVDRGSHRREIDDGRNTREVLKDHAGRSEGELSILDRLLAPRSERQNRLRGRMLGSRGAEQVLEEDLDRLRDLGQVRAMFLERGQTHVRDVTRSGAEGPARP